MTFLKTLNQKIGLNVSHVRLVRWFAARAGPARKRGRGQPSQIGRRPEIQVFGHKDFFAWSLDSVSQHRRSAQALVGLGTGRSAFPERGPCYAFPDVHVANGSTGRGAVLLPPSQSTKHPSRLSCRYFLTTQNTRDSINCFKRSLSFSIAAPFSMPTSKSFVRGA